MIEELSEFTSEGISLKSLAAGLSKLARERKVFPPATDLLELNQKIWCKIYGELLTDEQRISLEGVGLVHWSLEWPDWFGVPQVLTKPPWNLTVDVAKDLLTILLDTLRGDRAVEIRTPKDVSISWNDLNLQASQMRFQIGKPGGHKGVQHPLRVKDCQSAMARFHHIFLVHPKQPLRYPQRGQPLLVQKNCHPSSLIALP